MSAVTRSSIPPDGSVGTAQLAAGGVTEAKLGSSAVTAAKIGTGAVTEAKIGSSAVTNAKIGSGAVDTAELAAAAVTNAKIANNAVRTAHVAGSTIGAAHMNLNTVTHAGTLSAGLTAMFSGTSGRRLLFPMVHGTSTDVRMAGQTTDFGDTRGAFAVVNSGGSSRTYDVDYDEVVTAGGS